MFSPVEKSQNLANMTRSLCRGSTNSAIHKANGSLVTGRSLQNGKMSMGNRHTERSPEVVLYGGRQSGGFVNRAVSVGKALGPFVVPRYMILVLSVYLVHLLHISNCLQSRLQRLAKGRTLSRYIPQYPGSCCYI